MIKGGKRLRDFYQKLLAEENFSYAESLRIYEDLYKEAISLGVIHSENIWDGFDADLRMAKAIHSLSR